MALVTREQVAKLYVATFNRAPDSDGLDYWVNDSGLDIEQIAESFFDQPETQALYDTSNSPEAKAYFVNAVYANLFNREPDIAGLNYWVGELDSGNISSNAFILAVMNGALNDDAVILSNKTTVGLEYSEMGLSDLQYAKEVIAGIDNTPESVDDAISRIASLMPDVSTDFIDGIYTAYYTGNLSGMIEFALLPDNTIQGIWVERSSLEYGSLSGEISEYGNFIGWTDDGSTQAIGQFIDNNTLVARWSENGESNDGNFTAELVNTDIRTLGQNGIIEYAASLGLI